jgi:carbonic anhydrase
VEANDVKLELNFSDISSGTLDYVEDAGKIQFLSTTHGNVSFSSEEETTAWTMLNFHFHAPSEHEVNSKQYDLEMHTVTTKDTDAAQYLVVGMFWELDTEAEDDPFIEALNLESIVPGTNSTVTADNTIPYKDLMDWAEGKQSFYYQGGLTTPDCTEAVDFFIVKEPRKINSKQLTYFNRVWKDYSGFSGTGTGQYR